VLGRVVLGAASSDPASARLFMGRLLARGDPATLLFGVLDLGARPCRPRRPMCDVCPARHVCAYALLNAEGIATAQSSRRRSGFAGEAGSLIVE
jgi:adenine-specific DNA glycosylase